MGLSASLHDPCLYSGHVNTSSGTTFTHPLHIGLYVDDFVFYTKDKTHEAAFKSELSKHIAVDWMGDVDFFLGTAFTWQRLDDGSISVHLSQATFTEHLAHRFLVDTMNKTPNMTPSACPSTPSKLPTQMTLIWLAAGKYIKVLLVQLIGSQITLVPMWPWFSHSLLCTCNC